jgi:tRNA pseudouridine38-40 synthase
MVGTLVEVGQEKRKPGDMQTILAAKDRRAAGYTAPAHGLYLIAVVY